MKLNQIAAVQIAAVQYAVFTRGQASQAGVSRAAIARRLSSGDWVLVSRRVIRIAGAPRTDHQGIMAAVLDAGRHAVASHAAAAWLWGIPSFSPRLPEVSRPRGSTGRAASLGIVHEPCLLPAEHVTVRDRVPVTTPERTLCDLAGTFRRQRVERAVDSALARSVANLARLWLVYGDLAARGRPGRTAMALILSERRPGYIAPESELEAASSVS